MKSAPGPRSDSAHTIFAEQQAIYRRVVDADYMAHRELFRILHDILKSRPGPFSFLDLASGDILGDFQDFLDPPPRTWDILFIGFSYHHLAGVAKLAFARKLRDAVSAGGEWIFFEPILCEQQTRSDYLERWKQSHEKDWKVFSAAEKSTIWDHVSNYDFPESCESFEEIASHAGFRAFEHLYSDPMRFYGAFRAMA